MTGGGGGSGYTDQSPTSSNRLDPWIESTYWFVGAPPGRLTSLINYAYWLNLA